MAWKKNKTPYESKRASYDRCLKEDPSRAKELHAKLSAEILCHIIMDTFWYGETPAEIAHGVMKYFEGVTKKEIQTATKQLQYVAKSPVWSNLSTMAEHI